MGGDGDTTRQRGAGVKATLTQKRLFMLLRDRPGRYTLTALARECRTSITQIWAALDWLEEQGIISVRGEE